MTEPSLKKGITARNTYASVQQLSKGMTIPMPISHLLILVPRKAASHLPKCNGYILYFKEHIFFILSCKEQVIYLKI